MVPDENKGIHKVDQIYPEGLYQISWQFIQ